MNFPIRHIALVFSLFLITPFTHTHEVAPEEPAAQEEQLSSEQFDTFIMGIVTLLQKFGAIMQSLADQISAQQIKVKNKQELLKHIILIKQNLEALEEQANKLIDRDINKIMQMLVFIDFFAQHVKALVDDNLATIPELDPTELQKRGRLEATPEAAAKFLENTESALAKLEKDAQEIGLTKLNKMVRKLESLNDRYNITGNSLKLAICGVMATLLVTIVDQETITNLPIIGRIPGLKKFKEWVGPNPQYVDKNLINEKELTVAGRIVHELGQHKLNLAAFAFTAYPIWKMFGDYTSKDIGYLHGKAENFGLRIFNYLRGGAARKKKMRDGKKAPTVTFNDGVGLNSIKYTLSPYIEYFCATEAWDRANIAPEAGIIFAGSSRTGKTYMAEMLAGTIKAEMKARGLNQDLTFLVFDAAEVLELGIDVILQYARAQAPCIIFIDEIDMLGLQRGTNGSLLSKFLTQMSGALERDANKRVILIGATNKPKNLDTALLQFGRFGKVIWFELPTEAERRIFLLKECTSRAFPIEKEFLKRLARETEGCSYETLQRIIKTAAAQAKLRGSAVKIEDIENAFDEEIREILPKPNDLPAHQLKTIATHLAGHALAMHLLDGQKKVSKVTVRPVKKQVVEEQLWDQFQDKKNKEKDEPIEYGKVFTYSKDQKFAMPSYNDLIIECKIALAGHAAEIVINGASGHSYHHHDHKEALSVAKYIVFKGMEPADLPKEERQLLDKEAYALMQRCEREVTELLTQHKEQLSITAELLTMHQVLSDVDIAELATITPEEIAHIRKQIQQLKEQARAAQHAAEPQKTMPLEAQQAAAIVAA